jgi:hypothetical protein
MIEELDLGRDPLGMRLVRMAAEFHLLRCSDPDEASRVADAARIVVCVWSAAPRVIGCLAARGGELLESGETDDIVAVFVADEATARRLVGIPAH